MEARKRAESDRARMLKLNRLVCEWLREQYFSPAGERARAYVEGKRGVTARVRDDFQLGYAPPGFDALTKFLAQQRVPHELCETSGLVRVRERPQGGAKLVPGAPPSTATHYDLFRDRVMFPVVSPQNEIIAFSGRALEDVGPDGQRIPKYINSPETIVYKKGEQLYGLHAARAAIRKVERAILVEGNFDVLMMHEHGFTETVAPMGTALTATQVRLLARSAPKRVFMLLDGDSAGSSAAARNTGLFLDEDQLSFVALLPTGDDPDTFVQRLGREALELLLSKAKESVEYFCEYGWNRSGSSVIERARLLEEEAAPVIRKVKIPAARQRFAERLALTLDLPTESVNRVLRGAPNDLSRVAASNGASAMTGNGHMHGHGNVAAGSAASLLPGARPDAIDLELVAILADQPQLARRLDDVLDCISSAELRVGLSAAARVLSGQSARLDMTAAAEALDPANRVAVVQAAMSGRYADLGDPEKALDSILRRRRDKRGDAELLDLKKKLADAQSAGDSSQVQQLTARINDLKQARLGLKG
jgi:DNA primase